MTGLALGGLVGHLDSGADTGVAIVIGVVLGVALSVPGIRDVTVAVCNVAGFLVALFQAWEFVAAADALTATYRTALMGLLFSFFVLGALVFDRAGALKGARGLVLLGLVDIVTFLASPGGVDLSAFNPVGHGGALVAVCVLAFALGWAASEYVLGVVALAVATTTLAGNAMVGDARQAWVGLVAAGVAVVVALLLRPILGREQ